MNISLDMPEIRVQQRGQMVNPQYKPLAEKKWEHHEVKKGQEYYIHYTHSCLYSGSLSPQERTFDIS